MELKVIQRGNPQAPDEAPKYYASAIHKERVEMDDLATMIAARCSIQRADVYGVLVALMDVVPDLLIDGNIVSLGDLGSFYTTVSSDGVESEEDLSVSMIRNAFVRYRPAKKLRKNLRMLDYTFVG